MEDNDDEEYVELVIASDGQRQANNDGMQADTKLESGDTHQLRGVSQNDQHVRFSFLECRGLT